MFLTNKKNVNLKQNLILSRNMFWNKRALSQNHDQWGQVFTLLLAWYNPKFWLGWTGFWNRVNEIKKLKKKKKKRNLISIFLWYRCRIDHWHIKDNKVLNFYMKPTNLYGSFRTSKRSNFTVDPKQNLNAKTSTIQYVSKSKEFNICWNKVYFLDSVWTNLKLGSEILKKNILWKLQSNIHLPQTSDYVPYLTPSNSKWYLN